MAVLGMRPERVPGSTYREKRGNVLRMSSSELKTCAADGGWYASFRDGAACGGNGKCLLAIPSTYLTVVCGNNARALRWAFAGDEPDTVRVRGCLQNLLDSFVELSGPNSVYPALGQHLGIRGV